MQRYLMAGRAGLSAAVCALGLAASAQSATPAQAPTQFVPDARRPSADIARDPARHPAELMAFAGVRRGDRVADVFAGGGYFTRLLSDAVGPTGRIYAIIPAEMARNCDPAEFAGVRRLAQDGTYRNVEVLTRPVADPTPGGLDVIWSSQNYHDLYDGFMEHADVAAVDRALFAALKPGGVLLVADHVAQAGSGYPGHGDLAPHRSGAHPLRPAGGGFRVCRREQAAAQPGGRSHPACVRSGHSRSHRPGGPEVPQTRLTRDQSPGINPRGSVSPRGLRLLPLSFRQG